jgi:mRNA-degrading endonuclease RelE of RelBE toxin-antitoxin system
MAKNIRWTQRFKKDFQSLPEDIKERLAKQLQLLQQNPHYPSLNTKKMKYPGDIWEGRITRSYRFTYQVAENTYILRRVGVHDILKNP